MKPFPSRIHYFDNLRTFIIILVIIHHLAISYGPPVFWFYQERTTDLFTQGLLGLFVSINQSFFMGLLIFISGYFTSFSYQRISAKEFFLRRLRYFTPIILIYLFLINPFIIYPYLTIINNIAIPLKDFVLDYYLHLRYLNIGPLWFLELLLVFDFIFIFINKYPLFSKKNYFKLTLSSIIIITLLLAIVTFIIRVFFPIGIAFAGTQIGYLPQYSFLFVLGFLANKNNWLEKIPYQMAKYAVFATSFAIIAWPVILLKGGALTGDFSPFRGNLTFQNFIFSFWETICGLSIIILLLIFFRKKLNFTNKLLTLLSRTSLTAFILHIPLVIALEYGLRNISIFPLFKFVLLIPISIFLTFFMAIYFTKIFSIGKR